MATNQRLIKGWEAQLSECEQALRAAEKQLVDLENQQQRASEKLPKAIGG
jgi:hypothetical protein